MNRIGMALVGATMGAMFGFFWKWIDFTFWKESGAQDPGTLPIEYFYPWAIVFGFLGLVLSSRDKEDD